VEGDGRSEIGDGGSGKGLRAKGEGQRGKREAPCGKTREGEQGAGSRWLYTPIGKRTVPPVTLTIFIGVWAKRTVSGTVSCDMKLQFLPFMDSS